MSENPVRQRRLKILLLTVAVIGGMIAWRTSTVEARVNRLLDAYRRLHTIVDDDVQYAKQKDVVKDILALGPEAPFHVLNQLTNPATSWKAHVWLFNKAHSMGIKLPAPLQTTRYQAAPAGVIQKMGTNALALVPALAAVALSTNLDGGAVGNSIFCLGAMGTNGVPGLIAVMANPPSRFHWLTAAQSLRKVLRFAPEQGNGVFDLYERTPKSDWDRRRLYFYCLTTMRGEPARTTRVIQEALLDPDDRAFSLMAAYAAGYFAPPSRDGSPPWSDEERRLLPEAKSKCVALFKEMCLKTRYNNDVLEALKLLDEAAWNEVRDQMLDAAKSRLQKR